MSTVPGFSLEAPPIPTNMVYLSTERLGISGAEFIDRMSRQGVLCSGMGPMRVRMVTNYHFSAADVDRVVSAARQAAKTDTE